MHTPSGRLLLGSSVLSGILVVAVCLHASGDDTTVSSGVYTSVQATRGKALYETRCSSCHDGGIMGPELWGSGFLAGWKKDNLASLSRVIKDTMPADEPGTVNEIDALDIVAYLLQANGFPPGARALDRTTNLESIVFAHDQ